MPMDTLDSQTPPDVPIAPQLSAPAQPAQRRSYPAITHLAVLTLFVAPLTLFPYLAVRRNLYILSRRIDEVADTTARYQQDLRASMLASTSRREEEQRLRSVVHETKQELIRLRHDVEQGQKTRAASEMLIRSELRKLSVDQPDTATQSEVLKELGTSLADVAAFMHEVELQDGLPSRGRDGRAIDRLRMLALRMQNLSDARARSEKTQPDSP